MSSQQASEPPALRRWVVIEAAVNSTLYYQRRGYKSNADKKGCRTYLMGSFKSAADHPLPFKVIVEDDPTSGCDSTELKRVDSFSELPLNQLAKIAPGDFSLTKLLELKTPEDYENYMAETAPGKFKGFIRTKNLEQFPGDVTYGRKPRCWLDINAGPSFFSTINFLIMAASAFLLAAILISRGKKRRLSLP